jgi:hypothetical protein
MIYTSYYGNIKKLKKAGVKSIAISLSIPSYLPHIDRLPFLAPPYELLEELNIFKFRAIYIEHLEKIGIPKIRQELERRKGDIALLCYESISDITSGAKFCHRRIFAAWYESKTGVIIPEYDILAIKQEHDIIFPTLNFMEK